MTTATYCVILVLSATLAIGGCSLERSGASGKPPSVAPSSRNGRGHDHAKRADTAGAGRTHTTVHTVEADTDGEDGVGDATMGPAAFCQQLEDEDVFGRWDADRDSRIDTDELAIGTFAIWDTDDDAYLTEREWRRNRGWFDVTYDYPTWDTDGDERLDEEEFVTGFRYNDVLSQWAGTADNLDRDDFCREAFTVWDENGSGKIEPGEWNRLSEEWL